MVWNGMVWKGMEGYGMVWLQYDRMRNHAKSFKVTGYHIFPYPTLPYPTLPYPTLPYPTLPYPTYPTLPYPTLPYPTLPYLPHHSILTMRSAPSLQDECFRRCRYSDKHPHQAPDIEDLGCEYYRKFISNQRRLSIAPGVWARGYACKIDTIWPIFGNAKTPVPTFLLARVSTMQM